MRGLKDKQTANTTMDGQRIYYNLISPHMSPDGKTPAEACGIEVKGKNGKH